MACAPWCVPLANTTPSPGLAEGLAWMAHAARVLHYPPAPRGWRAPLVGRDGRAGPLHGPRQSPAPRAGPPPSARSASPPSGAAPQTRRGSRRSPSTIQLSACWLTNEAGPVYDEPSLPSRPHSYKNNVRILLLFQRESQEISARRRSVSRRRSARAAEARRLSIDYVL